MHDRDPACFPGEGRWSRRAASGRRAVLADPGPPGSSSCTSRCRLWRRPRPTWCDCTDIRFPENNQNNFSLSFYNFKVLLFMGKIKIKVVYQLVTACLGSSATTALIPLKACRETLDSSYSIPFLVSCWIEKSERSTHSRNISIYKRYTSALLKSSRCLRRENEKAKVSFIAAYFTLIYQS